GDNIPLYTYSAFADFLQRGNIATEKGGSVTGKRIRKLENLEISKFVGGV
ncbi:hypothetical protein HMPREF9072_01483, partial [Capnocytophaga sp. oral taxon 324 str. F0483]